MCAQQQLVQEAQPVQIIPNGPGAVQNAFVSKPKGSCTRPAKETKTSSRDQDCAGLRLCFGHAKR